MPVQLTIANDRQIVCPVRFARAVEGDPVADAPEIDDRGWNMHRPNGWVASQARGPMVGITTGDTVRVKVVREDLDAGADLFVTVSADSPPQVSIAAPQGGGPLPADGVFSIEALESNDTASVVEVRLGSASGPVIAELEPHVFDPLTLRIVPHVVTVHASGGSGGTAPDVNLDRWFEIAQAIYKPAGVRLQVERAVHSALEDCTMNDLPRISTGDFNRMLMLDHRDNRCNIYFVHTMDMGGGVGINRQSLNDPALGWTPVQPFIAIGVHGWQSPDDGGERPSANRDLTMGNDIAHEIGHFLTLAHAGGADGRGRGDTFSKRNLMHNMTAPDHGRVADVGYGRHIRGALITMKRYRFYSNDGQVGRVRARLLQTNDIKY